MKRLALASTVLMAMLAPSGAHAQYYPRDYYGRPYDRPYGGYDRPRIGFRCDATAATPGGGRTFICPIRRPRPLGEGCECPPPRPPPGFSYGPPLPGRVIP